MGTRKKDAVLSDENRAESERLKKLYEKASHGLSQAEFGATFEIGNQGAVWQCLNGVGMPISLKAARGFARGLGVDIADFSPRLAAEAAKNAEFAPPTALLWPFPADIYERLMALDPERRSAVRGKLEDAVAAEEQRAEEEGRLRLAKNARPARKLSQSATHRAHKH